MWKVDGAEQEGGRWWRLMEKGENRKGEYGGNCRMEKSEEEQICERLKEESGKGRGRWKGRRGEESERAEWWNADGGGNDRNFLRLEIKHEDEPSLPR